VESMNTLCHLVIPSDPRLVEVACSGPLNSKSQRILHAIGDHIIGPLA